MITSLTVAYALIIVLGIIIGTTILDRDIPVTQKVMNFIQFLSIGLILNHLM